MTALIIGAAGLSIGAVLHTVSSITSTSMSIYEIISHISILNFHEEKGVADEIYELDINTSVKIVSSILREINVDKISYETIKICLDSLKDVVEDIEFELLKIKNMVEYNNSIWVFKGWRSHKFKKNIEKLRSLKKLLDTRFEMLINLLQIKIDLIPVKSNELAICGQHLNNNNYF